MKVKASFIMVAICMMEILIISPTQSDGSLITIEIEAVVDNVHDPANVFEGKINPDNIIVGSYTYDSDTPDSNPSPYVGDYKQTELTTGIVLSCGGYEFRSDKKYNIEILNDHMGRDAYALISYENVVTLEVLSSFHLISLIFDDTSMHVFLNDNLPINPPSIEYNWDTNYLYIEGNRGGVFIEAHVVSAIPEPMSITMLILGSLIFRKRNNFVS